MTSPKQISKPKVVFFIAFFGLIVLIYPLLRNAENWHHVNHWTPVRAEIIWRGEKCEMLRSSGENSFLETVIDCADVKNWKAANRRTLNGRQIYFKADRRDYVRLRILKPGPHPTVLVRTNVASPRSVTVSDQVELFANPYDMAEVDRAYLWYEYWFLILYYACVVWLIAVLATKRRAILARFRQTAAEVVAKAGSEDRPTAGSTPAPHKVPLGVPHFFP